MINIQDEILEKLICGNNMTMIELCDRLGYDPKIDDMIIEHGILQKMTELGMNNVDGLGYKSVMGYKRIEVSDLLKSPNFLECVDHYISNLGKNG